MSTTIRDVREHELDSVLALNNAAGPTILPMDAAKARYFYEQATYFRVAEVDGHLAGFLIAFDEQSAYHSSNFLWFRERMRLVYIDRVVSPATPLCGSRRCLCRVQSFAGCAHRTGWRCPRPRTTCLAVHCTSLSRGRTNSDSGDRPARVAAGQGLATSVGAATISPRGCCPTIRGCGACEPIHSLRRHRT